MLIEIDNYLLASKENVQRIILSATLLIAKSPLSETNKIVVNNNLADITIEIDMLCNTHDNVRNKFQETIIFANEIHGSERKCSVASSVFKWLFGEDDNSDVIKQLKENINILAQNQQLQQDQIKKVLKMNELNRVEIRTNCNLLKQINMKIIQLNNMVH